MFNSPRRRGNVRVFLFIGNVARTVQCQAASGAQASSQGQGHSAQRTIFVGSTFGFFSDSCFYQSKCCKSRIFRNNLQSSKRTCLHQNFSVCSPSVHSEPPAIFSVLHFCAMAFALEHPHMQIDPDWCPAGLLPKWSQIIYCCLFLLHYKNHAYA